MIRIRGVHKSFDGNHVLRGVDLDVEQGEAMVVIGRSGCGKSVLLKHIIGLMKPDRGSVVVAGHDVARMNRVKLNELRKTFGMLFQSAALFDSLTVAENVAFGLRRFTDMTDSAIALKVAEKLELVGLSGVESLRPAQLSGGMKKRAGLARALAMDPQIVLYDEPTTGIDPILSASINEMVRDLNDRLGVTSVVVTHDMASANILGDRIAMLHEGVIRCVGTPQDIQTSDDAVCRQFVEGRADNDVEEPIVELGGSGNV
jgi:phospholipid/cholesterol/gamma-HCH transport system ATP-binding protein